MNISKGVIKGNCRLKCSFNFSYSKSVCNVRNMKDSIRIKYDKTNVPPVTYNGNKYMVEYVEIVTQPYLKINNVYPVAYFVVQHKPIVEGLPLRVVVPIIESSYITPSGEIIESIVKKTLNQAPKRGNESTLSINNFNLESLVPNKPFFTYTHRKDYTVIVYDNQHAIPIGSDTVNLWRSQVFGKQYRKNPSRVIQNYSKRPPLISVVSDLYYNPNGPNSSRVGGGAGSDDIYIDCQPVNVGEEKTQVKMNGYKLGTNFDIFNKKKMLNALKNPWVQGFILFLVILLMFFIVRMLLAKGKSAGKADINVS